MTVPFGFSVGDFVAAIGLVARVADAVRDSGGAAAQYQSLARDLANLQTALLRVEALQVAGTGGSVTGTLYNQTLLVRQSVRELLDRIARFDRYLGDRAEKGWRYGTRRKMQWAVFQSKEVAKLRDVVASQLQNLGLLVTLQILEAVQRTEMSQQKTHDLANGKIEASKGIVTSSTSALSSAQVPRTESVSHEVKSSFDTIRQMIESSSQSDAEQFGILDEAIQKAQEAVETSSDRTGRIVESESQSCKADLSRLDQAVERAQKAIADLSESSSAGIQLAAQDIKRTLSATAGSVTTSHALFMQNMVRDLEGKITNSITSAIERHGRTWRRLPGKVLEDEDRECQPEADESKHRPMENPTNVAKRSEKQVEKSFFEDCLAQILGFLYASFRRMQLSLVWLLPLVSSWLSHMLAAGITRQMPQLLENSIRFEDALGRVSLLPYEHFQHWEMFKTMLNCKFKGFPGEQNVKAGLYCILRSWRPDQMITEESWQQAVLPGTTVNMSMIVWERGLEGNCPRCKAQSNYYSQDSISLCSVCGLEHQKTKAATLEKGKSDLIRGFLQLFGVRESPDEWPSKDKANKSGTLITYQGKKVQRNAKDIEAFRRIHLVTGVSRAMLKVALLHAKAAVLLDNNFEPEGATQSYLETCTLLSQIEERSVIDYDRDRLNVIRGVYKIRISELENVVRTVGDETNAFPAKPQDGGEDGGEHSPGIRRITASNGKIYEMCEM